MLLNPEQTRSLYCHAVKSGYAILAVNADSPAAITDALTAARELAAPIIIETSLWQLTGVSFGAGDPCVGIDRYLADIGALANADAFRSTPVVYHTDHIKGPETLNILRHAMDARASSISLDSSDLSAEDNIGHMNALCAYAKERGLRATLEMEAGVDDGVTEIEETDALFGAVEECVPGYLALWAPGVGTQHGLGNDMKGFSPDAVARHRERASAIAGRPIGIALHGSSGLSESQLGAAVDAGVAKVNWSSESLLIRSQAARDYYRENGECLEKGHPEFKVSAMDNGVQSYVSGRYRPKVGDRIRVLKGEGQGARFMQQSI